MTAEPREKTRNKKKIVPIALASIAVIGVGAALTSAAWTDDVTFGASAASQSFDIQGSVDGGATWKDVAGDNATITFSSAALAKLSPGDIVNLPFKLKNDGTADAKITAVVSTPTGPIFTGAKKATVAVTGVTAGSTTIAPAAEVSGIVTVTVPGDWDSTYMSQTGSLTVTFTGTSQ